MTQAQRVAPFQAQTGVIQWDQPERQSYQAGTPLTLRLRVTNPTASEREYQLYQGLYDPQTGQLIEGTLALILVDGEESFGVPGGSYVEMQGQVTLERTGVILAVSLYDVASQAVVGQVGTVLEAPGAGTWEQIVPMVGIALAGGMVGMVLPMATRMFKRKRGEG